MNGPEFWDADDEAREEALSGLAEFPIVEAVYAVSIYGLGEPIRTTAHVHTADLGHDGVLGDVVAEIVTAVLGETDLVGLCWNGVGSVVPATIAWDHCFASAAEHAVAWFEAHGLDLDQVQGFVDSHW